jgi:hypothetical protein
MGKNQAPGSGIRDTESRIRDPDKQKKQFFCLMMEDLELDPEPHPYLRLRFLNADPGGRKHTDCNDPDPQH